MAARHGTIGESEGHDGQTVSEGNRGETWQADTVADHGRGAGADEYQGEGADELRKQFWCNPVRHG